MTNVNYNYCDRCGKNDNPQLGQFHMTIHDINGAAYGHLCEDCTRICTPEKGKHDRPA